MPAINKEYIVASTNTAYLNSKENTYSIVVTFSISPGQVARRIFFSGGSVQIKNANPDTNCIKISVLICAVTEPLIQFYFSSVRVFKFSARVFKFTQGYSNRRMRRRMGAFRKFSALPRQVVDNGLDTGIRLCSHADLPGV